MKLGHLKEVFNKDRKFGSASVYYTGYVKIGTENHPVLFTFAQIKDATDRAIANPEDIEPLKKSLLQRIIAWF